MQPGNGGAVGGEWMGLRDKAGEALGLEGYQAGKEIRRGQMGLELMGLGCGVSKERQRWKKLVV